MIVGNGVYVGACDGELLSVRASDGKVEWRIRPDDGSWTKEMPFDMLPVTAFGTLLVGRLTGHVWALDSRSGRALWHLAVASPGTPVVWKDRFVLRLKGRVVALDRQTGKVLWRHNGSTNDIATADDRVFLCDDQGSVVLGAADGKLRQRYRGSCSGQLVVTRDYVVTHDWSTVRAFERGTGREAWSKAVRNLRGIIGHGEFLYYATWDSVGILNLRTGRSIAKASTTSDQNPTSLFVVGGRLYVAVGDDLLCLEDSMRPQPRQAQ